MSKKIDNIIIRFIGGEVFQHERLPHETMYYSIDNVGIEVCIIENQNQEGVSIIPNKVNMIFERSRIAWHEVHTDLEVSYADMLDILNVNPFMRQADRRVE